MQQSQSPLPGLTPVCVSESFCSLQVCKVRLGLQWAVVSPAQEVLRMPLGYHLLGSAALRSRLFGNKPCTVQEIINMLKKKTNLASGSRRKKSSSRVFLFLLAVTEER